VDAEGFHTSLSQMTDAEVAEEPQRQKKKKEWIQ